MEIPFLDNNFISIAEEIKNSDLYLDPDKLLSFGNNFLNKVFRGIYCDDLIVLGAPTGVGKTQFCSNIALANVMNGKRVHYIALEESRGSIARRMKYNLVANKYFADIDREKLPTLLNFTDWAFGKFHRQLAKYEVDVCESLSEIKNFFTFYKTKTFTVNDLVNSCLSIYGETDLIIVDHLHYFDFNDTNENTAMKKICMTVRDIVLDHETPIILVAHLRKRDRTNPVLVPGIDDFHGSSDITKIATKVFTIAPGNRVEGTTTRFNTYFRILKNRMDGSVKKFLGEQTFDTTKNEYQKTFVLGELSKDGKDFSPLSEEAIPQWLK